MNDTNQNQTDIFGNVTPFQTQNPYQPEPQLNSQDMFQSQTPIQQSTNVFPNMNQMVEESPLVQPEPIPIIDIPQEEVIESQSFTEMPFAGVNQQENETEQIRVLESQPTMMVEQSPVEKNSNMQPVQKQEDENAGLKFLLVLGIIFAIVVLVLPLFPI